jgi:tetratricopeptide (TPR) repeat protein
MTIKKWAVGLSLLFLVFLTTLVYLPGLKGNFLFDDFSNLGQMNLYGDMSQWENAKKFVMNGIAGPTGRPIALLTYVPQAEAWVNGDAYPFKVVNLIIHLLCGVLLYWVMRLILISYGEINTRKIQFVALMVAGIWMLHPFMLSTTLYVIQRMAQLPLLFTLLAMLGYLIGRGYLQTYKIRAYVLMSVSLTLGTLFATLSKENGALLPLLVLVVEFCNPDTRNKPAWQWRAIFLWLPSVAILAALSTKINLSDQPWANRDFNQIERLLTESRVMVNYLMQLYLPQIEGDGLFQDGYLISRTITAPITTLYSIIFLSILFISAFFIKNRMPLVSMAILFFFAAHLMESTIVGLELYFEHRNYLAAIFIFLPLVLGLYTLTEFVKPSVITFIAVIILSFLSFLTYQRAILWSDDIRLMWYWAQNSPNSARAQSVKAAILAQEERMELAQATLEKANQNIPNDGMLIYHLLQLKIENQGVNFEDFGETLATIPKHKANAQALIGLRDLIDMSIKHPKVVEKYQNELLAIINATLKNPTYGAMRDYKKIAYFLKGQIYSVISQPADAYKCYLLSLEQAQDVEHGIYMSIQLGNLGYLKEALDLLKETEAVYRKQPTSLLKKSEAFYDDWLKQTKDDMQKDLSLMQMENKIL